ncbi:proline hydroxylase [Catellatospora sp. TT07R-123]|uniref:2OG-Fe(II) oxygenase n=1 Tax=Catellatospora sp. TT07R-123 TaxID=2733863 RepID=UPI001B05CAD1|nr:2OG-Fe(II) oxygenase [Catellatospora sp. TT07R-123]GHJ48993.1 proline hydroxylase [Catellatospora sp. TT07R-123]
MSGDVVYKGSRFSVVDNFLDAPTLAAARDWARSLEMEFRPSVIGGADNGSWRSANFSHASDSEDAVPHIGSVLAELTRDETPWMVRSDARASSAVWRYPKGSSLGWHNDWGGGRVGEFVLFLHPEWRPDWGGELVVLDEPAEHVSLTAKAGSISVEEYVLGSKGMPTMVAPKPNRIVFLQAGTPHTVKRVEASWGEHERLTHTGFVSSREAINRQRMDRLMRVVD